jgi:6-phosphofructokinase 1
MLRALPSGPYAPKGSHHTLPDASRFVSILDVGIVSVFGDIGVFLREAITRHFRESGTAISLKYIDPSYAIRSVPATPHDSAFCLLLGHNAVHAGMSGRTDMVIGFWNHHFTHVPIALAVSERKKIDPTGSLWSSVLASTGQPAEMR